MRSGRWGRSRGAAGEGLSQCSCARRQGDKCLQSILRGAHRAPGFHGGKEQKWAEVHVAGVLLQWSSDVVRASRRRGSGDRLPGKQSHAHPGTLPLLRDIPGSHQGYCPCSGTAPSRGGCLQGCSPRNLGNILVVLTWVPSASKGRFSASDGILK